MNVARRRKVSCECPRRGFRVRPFLFGHCQNPGSLFKGGVAYELRLLDSDGIGGAGYHIGAGLRALERQADAWFYG